MIRILKRVVLIAVATLTTGMLYSAPAAAQATRTWISGVGDDANPCSRTAPCKTFQGALPKTAAGGEINCLDPGGFGAVTITKSISIICDNTESGILVAATNAIIVNGTGAVVQISGLDFEGLGQTGSSALSAIWFANGASLTVRNSKMRGFRNSYAINFAPSSSAALVVDNVTISESGIASNPLTGGILVGPLVGASVEATLTNVQIVNGLNAGLRIDTQAGAGTAAAVTVKDTLISNTGSGITLRSVTGAPATLTLTDSIISGNAATGIMAKGAASVARVGTTTITGNLDALSIASGASILTYGDNRLDGNTNNTAFTLPVIPTH
ncbi:MAG: right-handed parallel beta-helix repeat-containing protein [Sphingomonas sp.]